jgi:thiol-disulfide isomerase/thioredoxin
MTEINLFENKQIYDYFFKPSCPHCDKYFASKFSVDRHIKKKHPEMMTSKLEKSLELLSNAKKRKATFDEIV